MSNSFNFNSIKKQFLTTTLPDENNTTILVLTPNKKLMDELVHLESTLQNSNAAAETVIDDLYSLVAKLMSCNKGGVVITKDKLEECVDFEDLIAYFKVYTSFVHNITSSKN